jgi:hypothetical protein
VWHDFWMLAGLKRHQTREYTCCEQSLPLCWNEEAAPCTLLQLGLLAFHIACMFLGIDSFDVGSAYWLYMETCCHILQHH